MRYSDIFDEYSMSDQTCMLLITAEDGAENTFELSDQEVITRYASNPNSKSIWIFTDSIQNHFLDLTAFIAALRLTYSIEDRVIIVAGDHKSEESQALLGFGNVSVIYGAPFQYLCENV